nr:peripheral-type benzodiazepine receptor-associated protein 1-like [Penaeus vannamei]
MDEDGFFDGELLDGRRGLVPSNFVEKLVGEDLIEFHQSVVMGLRDGDESMSTSVPQDLDFISQDESQLIELAANQTRHNAYTSYIDLEDIIEEEEETLGEHERRLLVQGKLLSRPEIPPPVQLTLERQLNKSILIGWNPPPDAPPGSIESYHVYVNGLLKTTVRASERTRALVEGVDSTKLHRISVRSVTPNRRTSRDAACTMVIGKDAPLGPTSVKATSITSTSAVISWLPSNSNFQHTVCVNNVEVRTVKPGVYRHTITGLSPNTTYRVTIRAKNLRAPQFDEKATRNQDRLSTTIEFRTLPKDPKGLPDPPVDVQVEPGPQDGSLLVTWLPVTINSTGGTSNGAPVTGYAVYADGKKVTEVESPTGDHALIDLTKIPGFEPKQVTVRTKSRDSVSGDSVPSQIPSHFARDEAEGSWKRKRQCCTQTWTARPSCPTSPRRVRQSCLTRTCMPTATSPARTMASAAPTTAARPAPRPARGAPPRPAGARRAAGQAAGPARRPRARRADGPPRPDHPRSRGQPQRQGDLPGPPAGPDGPADVHPRHRNNQRHSRRDPPAARGGLRDGPGRARALRPPQRAPAVAPGARAAPSPAPPQSAHDARPQGPPGRAGPPRPALPRRPRPQRPPRQTGPPHAGPARPPGPQGPEGHARPLRGRRAAPGRVRARLPRRQRRGARRRRARRRRPGGPAHAHLRGAVRLRPAHHEPEPRRLRRGAGLPRGPAHPGHRRQGPRRLLLGRAGRQARIRPLQHGVRGAG